ncbi:MAG: 3-oxoacyl-ACP synthase III [Nitrospinae bacterium]|nr:3-oxoacyl-ACP synthase III [Nitrospinota bacterium]
MKFQNVRVVSFGYVLPPNVVTSAMIEQRLAPLYERLRLPAGRLELMTGIKERRFWNPGARPSSVAVEAGHKAIEASGIPMEKFGALFHASVCRDFLEPATACVDHHGLGLPPKCAIFDISNACLGVINGMLTVANMIELGQVEAGIIVAGEMGESLVESTIKALLDDKNATRQSIKPAFASLTIGSGAVAVVMASSKLAPNGHKLLGGSVRSATAASELCKSDQDRGFGDGAAPLMQTDSEGLLQAGCALAAETWKDFTAEMGMTADHISRSFTHQVGVAHRNLLYKSIGVDVEKDFATLEFLGNVGSVSLPVTLAIGAERGILKKGDTAALLGIGSGLNCMMMALEW